MNILIISHFKPHPPNHGAAVRIWKLALDYKSKGYNVTIVHNSFKRNSKRLVKNLNGIKIIQIPFLFNFMIKKHFIFQNNPLFIKEMIKENPDIVQVEFPYLIIPAIFSKLLGKKLIYSSHGIEEHWQKIIYNRSYILIFMTKLLEKLFLNISNKVICISNNDLMFYINNYKIKKDKLEYIPVKFNKIKYKKVNNNSKKIVLFIGSPLHPANKEAIMNIRDKIIPDIKSKAIKFYFVGKYSEKYIKNSGNMRVFSEVNNIKPYIEKCDLVILPILRSTGISIKLLELLNFNKKIIATPQICKPLENKPKNLVIESDINKFSKIIESIL